MSPTMFVPTSVSLGIWYGPNLMSYLATLSRIPTAGGHILKHSSKNLPI